MIDCRYSVYVIQLPDGTLYVGSTAKPVSARLAEHRAQRGSRCVLVGDVEVCGTRAGAERAEKRVAQRLRAAGYRVTQKGGSGPSGGVGRGR